VVLIVNIKQFQKTHETAETWLADKERFQNI
jgi:hypothetical protein